jgi:D-hexose-6-phosphate mutarotase
LRHLITIGKSLQHELITTNLDDQPMRISEALHTYFQVGDVRQAHVSGLSGCVYLDKVREFERDTQTGPIRFRSEVDRIYLDAPAVTEIRDTAMKRRIVIRSSGSHSTVVWNPWVAKAAQMGDLGPEGYLNMLCVETANAATDSITLAPGAQHRLIARYTIEAL